ncbi:uncharacterized protein LOC105185223 [Harpegnathos saltator]|uniref:uncharacterized protein LOC105185223 n=1 Tax=Harpegnathos saltator TaxID=610380 RepID=UPI00059037C5|nr:uncharacterized protein LOC105185223 [Harpegnathos saltator]
MKRYSSAPCLEDVGNDIKRTREDEQRAGPDTREYLQLALARILELQREIEEGTYVTEIDNGSNDLDVSGSEEDLTKEILAKVFQDLPGTSDSIAKIIDRETLWKSRRMDAIRNKRIQLLGFDACRRITLEFMKTVVRETRGRFSSLEIGRYDLSVPRDESFYSRNGILANDLREPSATDAQEIRIRMLKSLDLHLAAKQRDYTAKLMRSAI